MTGTEPIVGYGENPLDRRDDLRADAAAIGALRDGRARALLFLGDKAVLRPALRAGAPLDPWFALAGAERLGADAPLFLGVQPDGAAAFAGPAPAAVEEMAAAQGWVVSDLRSLAVKRAVDNVALSILGEAKSLLTWHATHPHCARCGAPSQLSHAGWRRDCPSCQAQHFPRTDPVVIMLIHRGDTCLLARKAMFPPGMISCLAGFVEPGETMEAAVRRETMEEAGLPAGEVRYIASQPWPMPFSQLMLGCFAEALADEVRLADGELEYGRWFTRAECRAMLRGEHPEGFFCPPPAAIANLLMKTWAEA